ncbi:hypothetical protein BGZ63DRAFT_369784, partial [Mariannaea sp. PMI_226]
MNVTSTKTNKVNIEQFIIKKYQKCQKDNSGTGNRTLGSAELISQVMRARNV